MGGGFLNISHGDCKRKKYFEKKNHWKKQNRVLRDRNKSIFSIICFQFSRLFSLQHIETHYFITTGIDRGSSPVSLQVVQNYKLFTQNQLYSVKIADSQLLAFGTVFAGHMLR